MRSRLVRIALLVTAAIIGGLVVWTFWVPTRDPGGRVIASGERPDSLSWSPDGEFVLYCDFDLQAPGAAVVCLARADGSGRQVLDRGHLATPVGWLGRPTRPVVKMSPGSAPDLGARLFSLDPQTGRKEEVSPSFKVPGLERYVVAPSLRQAVTWRSKGGKSVGHGLLLVSSTAGSREVSQRVGGDIPEATSWSPDETMIAFRTLSLGLSLGPPGRRYMVCGLAVIDIPSGSRMELAPPIEGLRPLAWSPDSEEIAFSITASDTPGRALAWAHGVCQGSVWGWLRRRQDFFDRCSFGHTRSVVYSVSVRGAKVRELLRLPKGNAVFDIAWSPTGKQLAISCYPNPTVRILDIPAAKPGDWRPVEDILPGFRSGD